MSKKHALVLRAFDHDRVPFAKDDTPLIDIGLFNDWSAPGVDLVRAATAEEIAAAKEREQQAASPPAPPADSDPADASPPAPAKSGRKAPADKA